MRQKQLHIRMLLLLSYAFLVPLGNLTRIGSDEGALGATTALLVLVVVISFSTSMAQFQRDRLLVSLVMLTIWMLSASLLAVEPMAALTTSATLAIYALAAATAYRYVAEEKLIIRLLIIYCLGGFLGAAATVIDYTGVIHIPGVNETVGSTATDLGYLTRVSGVFYRRSALAVHYGMIITISFLTPLLLPSLSTVRKIFFYSAALTCFVAVLLTHARAGVLAAVISIVLVLAVTANSPARLLRLGAFIVASGAVVAYIVFTWFPDVWNAYQALLGVGDVKSTNDFLDDSDALRLVLFKHVTSSLLSNPVGHGYSLLFGVEGYEERLIDPHNIFSQVIWGAGLFGIGWIIYFVTALVGRSRVLLHSNCREIPLVQIGRIFLAVLTTFCLIGMMHTIISTGIAWLFLGVYLRILRELRDKIRRTSSREIYAYDLSKLRSEERR